MKTCLIILTLLSFCQKSVAQLRIGTKMATGLAIYSYRTDDVKDDKQKIKPVLSTGVIFEYEINKSPISLYTDLSYLLLKKDVIITAESNPYQSKATYQNLSLPVMAKIKIKDTKDIRYSVSFGPELRYWVTARGTVRPINDTVSIPWVSYENISTLKKGQSKNHKLSQRQLGINTDICIAWKPKDYTNTMVSISARLNWMTTIMGDGKTTFSQETFVEEELRFTPVTMQIAISYLYYINLRYLKKGKTVKRRKTH